MVSVSMQEIKRELMVDTKDLSATKRKVTSAEDQRPSSQALGGFGVFMLAVISALVVVPDIAMSLRVIVKKSAHWKGGNAVDNDTVA